MTRTRVYNLSLMGFKTTTIVGLLLLIPIAQATDLGRIEGWASLYIGNGVHINLSNQNFSHMNVSDAGLNISINGSYIIFSASGDKGISNITYNNVTDTWSWTGSGTGGYLNVTVRTNKPNHNYDFKVDNFISQTKLSDMDKTTFFNYTWLGTQHSFIVSLNESKFRVEPTVVLKPLNDKINKSSDGFVELFMSNPTLNSATLHVDTYITAPSGIHVYGEGFTQTETVGTVYGSFDVPPGTSRKVYINVKSEKAGDFILQFTGMYYPEGNKDLSQPMSLKYPVKVTEPSLNPFDSNPLNPFIDYGTPQNIPQIIIYPPVNNVTIGIGTLIGILTFLFGSGILKGSKKREKKEKDKLNHSKNLVDKELKLRTDTFIGFSDDDSLKLCIKGAGLSSAQTYEDYSNEVDSHLKRGYSEVWKHKTECDSFIHNHNALAKVLLDATKEEILKEIKKRNLSLVEWDGKGQPPIKYLVPDYLFVDAGYVIQSFYERIFDIDQYCIIKNSITNGNQPSDEEYLKNQLAAHYPEKYIWSLTINHDFAKSDKNDMEELKQIIKAALNIALTKDDFGKLKKYKKDAVREHNLFVKGIIEIIKNVDNGIPLKDECEICKNY